MNVFTSRWPSVAVLALAVTSAVAWFHHPNCLFAEQSCGDYGTSVVFVDSPAEAAAQALEQEKLVFVLHVSGNFEESQYT